MSVRVCGVDGDCFFVVRQRAVGFVAQILVQATQARVGNCEVGAQGECILKGCFSAVGFFKAQIEQAHARIACRRIRSGSQICFQPVDDVVEVAILRESRACKTDEEQING